jgi:protein SCO1/2
MRFKTLLAVLLMASVQSLEGQAAGVRLQIPDVELINQDGQQVRFASDVIKDRVAVIDTVFTTCTTICPVMGSNYARLAKTLKDRLGRNVIMVSVSVDPLNDTPSQLKAWSAKFYTGPGWILLTGSKPQIDLLLKSLGLFTPERQDHQSTVLIGSKATGWMRASALASADKWLKIIDSLGSTKSEATKPDTPVMAASVNPREQRLDLVPEGNGLKESRTTMAGHSGPTQPRSGRSGQWIDGFTKNQG